MSYRTFQAQVDLMAPARMMARAGGAFLSMGPPWMRQVPPLSNLAAGWEMISRAGLTHTRPSYGFDEVLVGNEMVPVTEEAVVSTPFGDLLHFKKQRLHGCAQRGSAWLLFWTYQPTIARSCGIGIVIH